MQPFRFVHAADLHIDSPFRGLVGVNDEAAARLHDSTYQAFRNLVELCLRERADFLVIAGDVYDGSDRGVRAQRRFREGLDDLSRQGIRAFVAHGNHDPLDAWTARVSLPADTHVFGPEPGWTEARRDSGELLARIQGVSYRTRVVTDNLALTFEPPPATDGTFTIGVLHCNVGGNPDHDNYAPCTLGDLASVGIDYWALGHVHSPENRVLREQAPTIVYPGNTQGRHPNEPGPRGAMLVNVDGSGATRPRFVALDVVRWETLAVDVSGMAGLDALLERVGDEISAARFAADGRDLVCRVSLVGRGPVHRELQRSDGVEELLEELRAQTASGPGWTWVGDLRDDTRPELDLDAMASRDDFAGNVLRRAADLDPGACSELLAEVFGRRYAGANGPLDPPDPAQIEAWLHEARWYLAEALGGSTDDG